MIHYYFLQLVSRQPQPSKSHVARSMFSELQPPTSSNIVFSPELIKPFPKAKARKVINSKRRKTAILTDTTEKEALSLELIKQETKESAESSSSEEECFF